MSPIKILFLVFSIFSLVICNDINSLFSKEYFKYKNVKEAVIFACWSYYGNK